MCCNLGIRNLRFRYDRSHVRDLIPAWNRAKPLGFGLGGETGEGLGKEEGLLLLKAPGASLPPRPTESETEQFTVIWDIAYPQSF